VNGFLAACSVAWFAASAAQAQSAQPPDAKILLWIFLFVVGIVAVVIFARHMETREAGFRGELQNHGLVWHGTSMAGLVDGQPVRVRKEDRGGEHTEGTASYYVVEVPLSPPMDLGFALSQKDTGWGIAALLGVQSKKCDSGNAELDRAYEIHSGEPSRLRALLVRPKLAALLMHVADLEPHVTDEQVQLAKLAAFTKPAEVMVLCRYASNIAKELNAARAYVPPAKELAPCRAAWQSFASTTGLTYLGDAPMCVHGTIAGRHVQIHSTFESSGQYKTRVHLTFDPPLRGVITVAPKQSGLRGMLSNMDDVRVGHARFDETFLVKSQDPSFARRLLQPAICERLLAIQERNPVTMTERELTVEGPAPSFVTQLAPVLESARLAAAEIARVA